MVCRFVPVHFCSISMLVFLSAFSHPLLSSTVDVKGIDEMLVDHGVPMEFKVGALAELEKFLIDYYLEVKSMPDTEESSEIKEDRIPFMDYMLARLKSVQMLDEFEQMKEFYLAKRMIFSMIAEDYEYKLMPLSFIIKDIPTQFRSSLPYLWEDERNVPVGEDQAKKEAKNLFNPQNGRYFTSKELSRMSSDQISKLDIEKGHIFWKGQTEVSALVDPWKDIEQLHEKYLTTKVKENNPTLGEDFTYSLQTARSVLFYDGLKINDTNPKINTKDRYGIKWKMKWGAENHSEPVANDLFLNAGGIINDLVYLNRYGQEDFVLIFSDKSKTEDGLPECNVVSKVETFVSCFKKSKFKFDPSPYIAEKGIINESNLNRIVGSKYTGSKDVSSPHSLIGREYIIFSEVMAELRTGPFEAKGGAIALNSMKADEDRAIRGFALFNYWIRNLDARDPNGKGLVLIGEGEEAEYVETQHDLGSSMGSVLLPAHMNKFKTGERFMKIDDGKMIFREAILNRPHSWKATTFADTLWMGRHLAQISEAEIKRAVARTNWPDFMQSVYVSKLRARQLRILSALGLAEQNAEEKIEIPNVVVDLSTHEKRKSIAGQYNLPVDLLEKEMMDVGVMGPNGKTGFRETIIEKGKIKKCDDSIIVSLLEKYRYPSGLSRRVLRFFDNRGLRECHYD